MFGDPVSWRRMMTAVRGGMRSMLATPVVFTTSVATMTAGLTLLGAYLLLLQNMRQTNERLGEEFSIMAFLPGTEDPVPEQVEALRVRLEGLKGVETATYISRAEGLDRLRTDLGEESSVLEGLTDNPLPGAFELRLEAAARNPKRVRQLAAEVKGMGDFEDARYGEDWVSSYARVVDALEIGGWVLGLGLMLVLSVIVGGTVRLAVYARAEEIQIQRLVGAGGLYVRLPFYVQGALQGGAGAIAAIVILYALYTLGGPALSAPLQFLLGGLEPSFFGFLEMAFLLTIGITLGVSGAVIWLIRLEEA